MSTFKKAVCHVGDLQDGEKREIAINDGSILLLRLAGQYHALSSHCTHYGAPLVKGVLSTQGKLTCPWHGACFDVGTGDIEDAPALDALQSFPVTVENDQVYVEVSEEALRAGRRCGYQKSHTKKVSDAGQRDHTVVIVGGGAGGWTTVEALRQKGFSGTIKVVSQEPYLPIDRPKLTKVFSPQPNNIALRTSAQVTDLAVDIQLNTTATELDVEQQLVRLGTGSELRYDTLVLATGGIPRMLPVKGSDLGNVFTIRTAQDTSRIATALQSYGQGDQLDAVKLVIIGTSFIGLEYASVARQQGVQVTVVGKDSVPFAAVFGEKIGKTLQSLHESQGVNFMMETEPTQFVPRSQSSDVVGAVELADGRSLPADVVLVAVGVRPNTDWLKNSAIPLTPQGAVTVNRYLQVDTTETTPQHLDNVYAVGDIALFPSVAEGPSPKIRVEHWTVAQNLGRCAAANIVQHRQPKSYRHVPYFWTAQYGKSFRYCGHAAHYDDIVMVGDLAQGKWAAFYLHGDQVLAVASFNYDPIVSKCAQLMYLNQMPSASAVRDGNIVESLIS
ncbi:Apoptosis-inducing factor 1 [Dispira parvispora]|uniref:Apoptosis-inducing factor 1 n=1 Tax=Dispira parvispora TaxID=1520584 RepID=A0A9W8AJK1_9FUNG|nr:Apoptosis-inducing factor 1 [Dispira parvispora]